MYRCFHRRLVNDLQIKIISVMYRCFHRRLANDLQIKIISVMYRCFHRRLVNDLQIKIISVMYRCFHRRLAKLWTIHPNCRFLKIINETRKGRGDYFEVSTSW